MTNAHFFKAQKPQNSCDYAEIQIARQQIVRRLHIVGTRLEHLESVYSNINTIHERYLNGVNLDSILTKIAELRANYSSDRWDVVRDKIIELQEHYLGDIGNEYILRLR